MKRYKLDDVNALHAFMSPDENGVWVKYDDVKKTCGGCAQYHNYERQSNYCLRCSRNPDLADYYIHPSNTSDVIFNCLKCVHNDNNVGCNAPKVCFMGSEYKCSQS